MKIMSRYKSSIQIYKGSYLWKMRLRDKVWDYCLSLYVVWCCVNFFFQTFWFSAKLFRNQILGKPFSFWHQHFGYDLLTVGSDMGQRGDWERTHPAGCLLRLLKTHLHQCPHAEGFSPQLRPGCFGRAHVVTSGLGTPTPNPGSDSNALCWVWRNLFPGFHWYFPIGCFHWFPHIYPCYANKGNTTNSW